MMEIREKAIQFALELNSSHSLALHMPTSVDQIIKDAQKLEQYLRGESPNKE